MHDQKNYNCPNMKLDNFHGIARMNWTRQHGTLKFTPDHMNYFLVEMWEAFKLSSTTITYKAFKKTPPPLSPHEILAPTTKLVLLVLNSQKERNRMILDVYKRPVLRL